MDKPIIYLATQNQHKVEELLSLIGEQFLVRSITDLAILEEIPETGSTLSENSMQKAQYIAEHFGVDCVSDDSGLEVEALNGEPGVYSARYAGIPKNDDANMQKLLLKLEGEVNRKARFVTVLTYHSNGYYHQFEGIVDGEIIHAPRGQEGFGYDPIFVPQGQTKTFGEMKLNEKNLFAHRARAFKKFSKFIDETLKC
ncbi:RdgB/HAM1 family non-canonical purine NTP pyrophosphatase [Aquirufa sp. ROCK2-A2]